MEEIQRRAERVAIFIDGSNFYHSVKDTLNAHDNEVDFTKLIGMLKNDRLLIGTFYYNAPLDRGYNEGVYRRQQRFFAKLGRIPDFKLVLCRMRKIQRKGREPEFTVKGDDIHIATDMLSLAYEDWYDTAILVSGDGDFVPMIKKVQKLGKKVENAYFQVSCSNYLKSACSSSVLLDEIVQKCLAEK